jgi:hypothetical protein
MSEKRPIYRSAAEERMYEHSYLNPEEAHVRAKEALIDYEIKPEMFVGFYDAAMLQRDVEEVARLEGLFEQNSSKIYADILEAIACEHGELSDWFGPKSQVIKTARFDDYKNRIDMIVETETDNRQFSHMALGIDVTFGTSSIAKKLESIKRSIDSGELGQVKYFHSDRQNITGRLSKIPQVVAGIEIDRVRELGLSWMNRRNAELAVHPVQMLILTEAALQLETFAAYAKQRGNTEIASILERELWKVRELITEKKAAGIQSLPHDKVFAEIQKNLSLFSV